MTVRLVLTIALFSIIGNSSTLNAQTKAEKPGFFKRLFGTAPKLESDGSYSPSKLSLKAATVDKSDFENISYTKYNGNQSKILVIFTEEKNLLMKNGK